MDKLKYFTKHELVIPATFPRATRLSTRLPSDKLDIAANIYQRSQSKSTINNQEISIFFCHANGFPKELYEPLFDDLCYSLWHSYGVEIKYILSTDVVNQGKSYALNEQKLGNDVRWKDYWNDVVSVFYYLQINNHPMTQIPMFGIGHSFGGNAIFGASSMNTRMFTSVVAIDGVISPEPFPRNDQLPILAFKRTDKWPSRNIASESLLRTPMLQRFDPRVREKYIRYAFRDLPTTQYPNDIGVTLSTPSTQELITFSPFPDHLQPDQTPFLQTGTMECYAQLPNIKVPKLMILGEMGRCFESKYKENYGNDKSLTLVTTDGSHLLPLEESLLTAEIIAKFLAETLENWKKEQSKDLENARTYGFHPIYKQHFGPLVASLNKRQSKI